MIAHSRWFHAIRKRVGSEKKRGVKKIWKYVIVFASTQLRITRLRKYPNDPKAYLRRWWGLYILCLPPYNLNFRYFKIKPLIQRTSNLQDLTVYFSGWNRTTRLSSAQMAPSTMYWSWNHLCALIKTTVICSSANLVYCYRKLKTKHSHLNTIGPQVILTCHGRGLGLYRWNQVCESEGMSISLDSVIIIVNFSSIHLEEHSGSVVEC